METIKRPVVARSLQGDNTQSTEVFMSNENTSNDIIMNIGHYTFAPLQYSCLENPTDGGAWKAAVCGVAKSRTRLSDFTFTFHFHALEKEMATPSSVLAWRIPGTGEPGGLPSMGSHRVGYGVAESRTRLKRLSSRILLSKLTGMCNITIFIKVNPKMKKTGKEFQDSESREFNPGWTPSERQSPCHCPGHVPTRQAIDQERKRFFLSLY